MVLHRIPVETTAGRQRVAFVAFVCSRYIHCVECSKGPEAHTFNILATNAFAITSQVVYLYSRAIHETTRPRVFSLAHFVTLGAITIHWPQLDGIDAIIRKLILRDQLAEP